MIIWIIAYLIIGASAFYVFHRFIRFGIDDAGDHVVGLMFLFAWPLAALCFAFVAASMGVVWLGNRIKGE